MHSYVESLGDAYNDRSVLNDSIHLITHHGTDEEFETVYEYLDQQRDAAPCNAQRLVKYKDYSIKVVVDNLTGAATSRGTTGSVPATVKPRGGWSCTALTRRRR